MLSQMSQLCSFPCWSLLISSCETLVCSQKSRELSEHAGSLESVSKKQSSDLKDKEDAVLTLHDQLSNQKKAKTDLEMRLRESAAHHSKLADQLGNVEEELQVIRRFCRSRPDCKTVMALNQRVSDLFHGVPDVAFILRLQAKRKIVCMTHAKTWNSNCLSCERSTQKK